MLCPVERDLECWGIDEKTLAELRNGSEQIIMAVHELLKPETFKRCVVAIRGRVDSQDVEELEDVLIGALTEILQNLLTKPEDYEFEDRGAVRRYLFGMVNNQSKKITNNLTKEARHRVPLPAELPVEMEEQQEHQGITVERILELLPFKFSSVLVLRQYGRTVAEIAVFLRIPEGTVKSRAYRGRQKLAHLLGRNRRRREEHNERSRLAVP